MSFHSDLERYSYILCLFERGFSNDYSKANSVLNLTSCDLSRILGDVGRKIKNEISVETIG